MLIYLKPAQKSIRFTISSSTVGQSRQTSNSHAIRPANRCSDTEQRQIHIQNVDQGTIYTDLKMKIEEDKLLRRDLEKRGCWT